MRKLRTNSKKKRLSLVTIILTFTLILIYVLLNSYAYIEPIKSIEFTSQKLDYINKTPGSFLVTKSARWLTKERARVTFDISTVQKKKNLYTDTILVIDLSDSIDDKKLEQLKLDTIELGNRLLEDSNNRVALIVFGTEAEIVTDFINNPSVLESQINNSWKNRGLTNYYDALVHVNQLLSNYVLEDDRECSVLFLTDGYADQGSPNEIVQYEYIKEQYPYLGVKAIQYEMGDEVLPSIKQISDHQYIANTKNLLDVFEEAAASAVFYETFRLSDWIDSDYFTIESVADINSSIGLVELTEEDGLQKVIWELTDFQTGTQAKLSIDLNLKPQFSNEIGLYSTNEKEEVFYQLENMEEIVSSNETPILATHYQVSYDGNAPTECTVSTIPTAQTYHVLETVEVSRETPFCAGYQFKGWKIVTGQVKQYSDDYFQMPESDVILRAEWSKLSLVKTVDGVVNPKRISLLQTVGSDNYSEKLWKYKSAITKIVFQDKIESISSEIESFDISYKGDNSVIARVVFNPDGETYTAYIQGDEVIYANLNSTYLFSGFVRLESIENLEILDTSEVMLMNYMFFNCNRLTNLDLSHFDTSNVTDMTGVFYNCNSLSNLNVSSFHTSKVMFMHDMFYNCSSLTNLNLSSFDTSMVQLMTSMFYNCSNLFYLDLSSFNTSKVKNMSFMFAQCYSLVSLDLSHFDTSNVINMRGMFYGGYNSRLMGLSSLNLSNFNTSKVTDMSFMFGSCGNLTTLDISHFDTSQVTDMQLMFYNCEKLESLNLNHFDTSKVTDMNMMFNGCKNLISLDISNFNTSNVRAMHFMFIYCSKLVSLDVSHFDTSKVTNMNRMFYDCSGLTVLDVSQFNTSNVTDMSAMFYNCSNVTVLDVHGFDTSNVTDMSNMFAYCQKLTDLNVSQFNTSKVENMARMFFSCESVPVLDVSHFETGNVMSMESMFTYCKSITNLDVSNFDTSRVLNMESMFNFESSNIKTLDVSNFDTRNVLYMNGMFQGAHGLVSLDLSSFVTAKVQRMQSMFEDCVSLATLIINFETPALINCAFMFSNCRQLESINLSNFDTSRITDMTNMFYNCASLTTLDIRNGIFNQVGITTNMVFRISPTVQVIVKDESAKVFWENLLGVGTNSVIIASEL